MEYFMDPFNLIDVGGLTLSAFIMLMIITELKFVSFALLRVLASIATCFNLMKIFDWLRLFSGTSFYIRLIGNTLADIIQFLLIFVVALNCFGIPLVFLDLNREGGALLI